MAGPCWWFRAPRRRRWTMPAHGKPGDHVRGRRLRIPAAWAEALATHFDDEPILVLPASPDGRDFAPRLAAAVATAAVRDGIVVSPSRVDLIRHAGTELHSIEPPAAFVATLQPGVRGRHVIDDGHGDQPIN